MSSKETRDVESFLFRFRPDYHSAIDPCHPLCGGLSSRRLTWEPSRSLLCSRWEQGNQIGNFFALGDRFDENLYCRGTFEKSPALTLLEISMRYIKIGGVQK
ncbi:hypothetical protein TNCV_2622341 [Trichonephila clavipes]|uniref:Uncharacterized protein n=1 Tax=Trichonephila clavipes TaxID=2585209 RepID=A0A8X6WCL1_TRICX|nr:hypothetical protein TNCV_2622341 [Trichonephila clavipes]